MGRAHRGVAALAVAVLVTACGSTDEGSFTSVGDAIDSGGTAEPSGDRGWLDEGSFDEPSSGGASEYSSDAAAGSGGAPETTAAPSPERAPDGSGAGESTTADVGLRAGWVDDNERWDDYLRYRQRFDALGIPVSPLVVEGRQVVRVVDDEGRPVLGALVEVLDDGGATVATLRTYADGRALFHAPTEVDPDSQSRERYSVRIRKGEAEVSAELAPDRLEHGFTLDAPAAAAVDLDVLFLIDATGSMSDEIARLQANIVSVAEQVSSLPGDGEVRFGTTVYRDRGDAFVTRTFDLTADVGDFRDALGEVVADGGGDMPEDLNAGLHDALTKPAWGGDDTIKLVFLVADAPPHLDYDGPDYADDAVDAAARGVKIVPIASSGLDAQGEFVFRQLAQVTTGRFVFLTYGADGASPGDATPHDVDDYSVLALDELVVRLVSEEIDHQR